MAPRPPKTLLELLVSNVILTTVMGLCGFVLGWLTGDLILYCIYVRDLYEHHDLLHIVCASVFVLIGILAAQASFFVHHTRADSPPVRLRFQFSTYIVWILALGAFLWLNVKLKTDSLESERGWPLLYYFSRVNSFAPTGFDEVIWYGNALCNAVFCGTITLMIAALAEFAARLKRKGVSDKGQGTRERIEVDARASFDPVPDHAAKTSG